jgi:uncharacterized protein YhaN
MRITRLLLARYGHLSDVELAFDPAVPLHIVLGANEAGKSTALSAIADALFGFPHRTSFDFLHAARDLRVGIGVQAADGRSGFFVRRKGRQDTLRDAGDVPVPESAIAAFVCGAARERFTEIFGMDGEELRRGGAAILEGKSEVGQSIVQAHTGLHHVRGAVARLNEAAGALYGDRRGERAFHVAVEAFRSAKADLEERSLRPAAYEHAAQEREACIEARLRNAQELEAIEAERNRLDRIRRTTPARLALRRDRASRASLGAVAALPSDSEDRRNSAVQSREMHRRELAREAEAQVKREAALNGLDIDDMLLAEGPTIDALFADLKRIEGARRDRAFQEIEAAQALDRLAEAGRRLGLAVTPEALPARLPDDLARAAALRAIAENTRLVTLRKALDADRQIACDRLSSAQAALAEAPPPPPADALVDAIGAARSEGRIDADLADAAAALELARVASAHALAALPHWTGSLEALASAAIPLPSAIAEASSRLAAALQGRDGAAREAAARDQVLQTARADLAGCMAAGLPPSAADVESARERRDRAWRLIRRYHVEAGLPPAVEEVAGLPADLPAALAGLIGDADSLADRLAAEAGRAAQFDNFRAQLARAEQAAAAARLGQEEAEACLAVARQAWEAIWRPSGVMPADPASMREWLAQRAGVVASLTEVIAKEAALARLRARRDGARNRLAAALPDDGVGPDTPVADLLRVAERRLAQRDAAKARRDEAAKALAEAERAMSALDAKRMALAREVAAWDEHWAKVAQGIGLPPGASAEMAADSLAIWADIHRHARDWRAARDRIQAMTADIDAFDALATSCFAACGTPVSAASAGEAVPKLAKRLAASRDAAARREDLLQDMKDRARRLDELNRDLTRAEDVLASLRALACVEDDESLKTAIARAQEDAALAKLIATREDELRRLDDGLSEAALEEEAEGADFDRLPGRIGEIDVRRRALAAENEALARRERDAESALEAMQRGQDSGEAAQRMQDAAAEAQDIAGRYVRLRLSHALLRAGIERFRREQQAPLLAAAGALFASLTERRYDRLGTDEAEDGKMVVVAHRPDGTHCPADRLSEGTRDQLYLALRLAAIGTHAAHTEPLPFIADDLLASFDDRRARAALRVLADFGAVTQTILFTHHAHIAAMADPATTRLHHLPDRVAGFAAA